MVYLTAALLVQLALQGHAPLPQAAVNDGPRWIPSETVSEAEAQIGRQRVELDCSGFGFFGEQDQADLCLQVLCITRGEAEVRRPRSGPFQFHGTQPELADRELWTGIHERLELRRDGLEHSLLIEKRIDGEGDLVVRLKMETPFALARDGDGLMLVDGAGCSALRIGGVTGIDAAGLSAAGELRWSEGALEYVLPDAFLDSATWPVLVDPLIGGALSIHPDPLDIYAATAASGSANNYLVAFQNATGSLVAQRFNASTGAAVGAQLSIDTTGRAAEVVVGFCASSNRYLIVWEQRDLAGQSDLYGRTVEATTGALGSGGALLFTTGTNEYPLDISNETSIVDDELLLIYTDQSTYTLRQVNVPTSGFPAFVGSAVTLGPKQGWTFSDEVRISRQGGADGVFLASWFEGTSHAAGTIVARAFDRNAGAVGSKFTLQSAAGASLLRAGLDVDGDGARFLVTWFQFDPSLSMQRVMGARLDYNTLLGGLVQPVAAKALYIYPDSQGVAYQTRAAWTSEGGLVTSGRGAVGTGNQFDARLGSYDLGTLNPIESPITTFDYVIDIAAQYGGKLPTSVSNSNDGDDVLVVGFDDTVAGFGSIEPGALKGQRHNLTGRYENLAGGCGRGGYGWADGATPGKTLRCHLDTDQVTGTTVVLFGQEFSGLACNSCILRVDPTSLLAFALPLNSSGNADFSLALPLNPSLVGLSAAVQWASLLGGPLCTVLAAEFSNAIRVTIE